MNIIEFRPLFENLSIIKPQPSIECLPEWYKKSHPYENKSKFKIYHKGSNNLTYKKCSPYQDALSMGYILCLQEDLIVDQTGKSEYHIMWNSNNLVVSQHSNSQIENMNFDKSLYSLFCYKWMNRFYIKTKSGYSCLFTHPLNRLDLPFVTLSGVVDTDKHTIEINFPFLLKNNFNGIIPRGTPIVQIIPFKRENWKMRINSIYKNWSIEYDRYSSYLYNAYKKIAWSRKVYK